MTFSFVNKIFFKISFSEHKFIYELISFLVPLPAVLFLASLVVLLIVLLIVYVILKKNNLCANMEGADVDEGRYSSKKM